MHPTRVRITSSCYALCVRGARNEVRLACARVSALHRDRWQFRGSMGSDGFEKALIGTRGPQASRTADALSSSNEFGRCFAFRGAEGRLTVRLSRPVRPTHFSVEHLHAVLCDPARNANCSSAPQQMDVVGRSADGDLVEFGSFSYAASTDAPTVQTFAAASLGERVDAVTLRVKSNHGHPDYTCLYRFRVHGDE